MKRSERNNLKQRILRLAGLKCTGSPSDLALKLEISERSVKRIVSELREDGKEIRFSQVNRSYVTGQGY